MTATKATTRNVAHVEGDNTVSVSAQTTEGGKVRVTLAPVEDIKRDQDTIRTGLQDLDRRVHNNAVQCLLHASVHRDTSLMRRLIMDVLNAKNSGYRVQGLINWMRAHSPMELKGDTINLSGVDPATGMERPFLIDKADAEPFWTDRRNDEKVMQPVYVEGPLGKVQAARREFERLMANTDDKGQPKDPKKPFFAGKHADKLAEFFEMVDESLKVIPKDNSKELAETKKRAEQLGLRVVEDTKAA